METHRASLFLGPLFPSLVPVLTACAALAGCQPALPSGADGGSPGEAASEPYVALEPDAPLTAAPAVVRVRVVPASGESVDPSRVLFVKGHVGDGHVRQVENDDVSQALSERVVPAVTWSLADGSVVIAPSAVLEPGETYGVLSGEPPLGVDVRVAKNDSVPVLRRAWPPPEAPAPAPFAIFCGDSALASPPSVVPVSPGEAPARLRRGVFHELGDSCLRLDLELLPGLGLAPASGSELGAGDPRGGGPVVAPALVTLADGSQVRLDPAPIGLVAAPSVPPVSPLECLSPEIAFGPGCATIDDDRLSIAGPASPVLWAVRSQALMQDVVRASSSPSEPWMLAGFSPGETANIAVVALDLAGRPFSAGDFATPGVDEMTVTMEAPMPHVVISEVMANPLGPEPEQEWVEIYNDGVAPADLTGYLIQDLGGSAELPPVVLEPGGYALIVNEDFVEDDEVDVPPATGTLLIRVPKLGKDGLKNDGEPLKLLDAAGEVVSRFPLAPKPKAGQSVARVSPDAPDDVPSSFVVATPTPGAPNLPPP